MKSRLLIAMAICAGLQACMGLPADSLRALGRINPATTDAAQIRMAVYAPAELKVRAEDAKISFTYRNKRQKLDVKQDFAMQEVAGEAAAAGLPPDASALGVLHIFRLRPDEAVRLERSRQAILVSREPGDRTEGSVAVSASGCITQDKGQPLPLTAFLKTAETGRFVLVLKAYDLRAGAARGDAPPLQKCQAGQRMTGAGGLR